MNWIEPDSEHQVYLLAHTEAERQRLGEIFAPAQTHASRPFASARRQAQSADFDWCRSE